jgi:hypothetical protein
MFKRLKGKLHAVVPAASLAVLAGSANAAIDTTAITGAITEGQTAAVLVAVAFGVAVWAIRGVKMIRRA